MARIFYRTATGNIYGVHPGSFAGTLPADIDFIDVAEQSDQIVWPINVAGESGEQFAQVQGGILIARDRPDFDAADQVAVDRLLQEKSVIRALATLQFQMINDVRVLESKSPITVEQYKTRLWKLIRGN